MPESVSPTPHTRLGQTMSSADEDVLDQNEWNESVDLERSRNDDADVPKNEDKIHAEVQRIIILHIPV